MLIAGASPVDDGILMRLKAMAQRSRPTTMIGIEKRRIRRRPTRSMRRRAKIVKTKFVAAIESDGSVGAVKPTRAKIVAEKYIKEF